VSEEREHEVSEDSAAQDEQAGGQADQEPTPEQARALGPSGISPGEPEDEEQDQPGQDAESAPWLTVNISVTVRAEASEAAALLGKAVQAVCPGAGGPELLSANLYVVDGDREREQCLQLVSRGGADGQVFVHVDDPCGAAQHARAIGGLVAELDIAHDFRPAAEAAGA
jgi:hypothetical protein